ncbi:MAG: hypothetical protein CL988_02825 [Euryarchaeota archaeon]|nr:hypothetical protein [Euryarchaeota archaeon]
MNHKKVKGLLLIALMAVSGLAGCLGTDDDEDDETASTMDAADGGYTYASNVDNHRSLMKDLCDIKTAASAYDWTTAKDIYTNGKNAQKSDDSFRTLAGFAAAEGKNHNYDTYYNQTGSIGAHIMAALDGTGDFEGTSDTVRYQGVAKLTANMGMVGYTIHELNAAIAKADAGNVDDDSGAPHNWDEGWAFFHGPDEDNSCGPVATLNKRGADFGTETDGVSNTFIAIEDAMVAGLTALQAEDSAGYTSAANTVVKNVITAYSQAVLKYTSKMDNADSGEKYQAEAYAFWKVMEAYSAPHMHDGCYNMAVGHKVMMMGEIDASACDAFIWTNGSMDSNGANDTCYNTVNHMVSTDATDKAGCDGYTSNYYQDNYAATLMNNVLDLTDATQLGTSYDVTAWLQPVWDHYGITSDDIGTYA